MLLSAMKCLVFLGNHFHNVKNNVLYNVTVDVESPVDPPGHFTCTTANTTWKMNNDLFYTASKVTVSIVVSCTVTGKKFNKSTLVYKGQPVEQILSHTATLPPPKAVTIGLDSEQALVGKVQGISADSKAIKIELLGCDASGKTRVLSSQHKALQFSGTDVSYTFPPDVYMEFSCKAFSVRCQSLREGLQTSVYANSQMVHQAPPLQGVSHTLPVFADVNKSIDVKWTPPKTYSATDVDAIICQIRDTNTGEVIFRKQASNPLPNMVSFSIVNLPPDISPTSRFLCRAAFIPSVKDVANSPYTDDPACFEVLSAPGKLSISYLEKELSGALCIAWLPLSDVFKYQVVCIDVESKVVAVSTEFDITNPAQIRSTGQYMVSYNLSLDDMTRIEKDHHYNVNIYSLGDVSSSLFSVKPKTFPWSIQRLQEVKSVSATYNPNSDVLDITCSPSPGAMCYRFYLQNKSPSGDNDIVTKFDFPAPSNVAKGTLRFSKTVCDFNDTLSSSDKYSLVVRAFGDIYDVASRETHCVKEFSIAETPAKVTYLYDPNYDKDTVTVICEPIPNFSNYILGMRRMQDKKITISATVKDSQNPSVSFKRAIIGAVEGGVLQCIAKTIGKPLIFNSVWANSPAIIKPLSPPKPPEVTFGVDCTTILFTYPVIANSEFYLVNMTTTDQVKIWPDHMYPSQTQYPAQKVSTDGKEKLAVTFSISNAEDSVIEVSATAIAAENGSYLNSVPGNYKFHLHANRLNPPQNFQYKYSVTTGLATLKWSAVQGADSYTIRHCQNDSSGTSLVSQIAGIPGEFECRTYNIFAHQMKVGASYFFDIQAHSSAGNTPMLPSDPITVPGYRFDHLLTGLSIKHVDKDIRSISWSINREKYDPKDRDLFDIAIFASENGAKFQLVKKISMPSSNACTEWKINVTPDVNYVFKVFSMYVNKRNPYDCNNCTIGCILDSSVSISINFFHLYSFQRCIVGKRERVGEREREREREGERERERERD